MRRGRPFGRVATVNPSLLRYSDRLLWLAVTLAENTANQLEDGSHSDDDGFEDCCYNLAALVNAAQHIPGDKAGSVRFALIQQVGGLIISLTKDAAIMNDGGSPPPSDQQTPVCGAWYLVGEVRSVLLTMAKADARDFEAKGPEGVMTIVGLASDDFAGFHMQPTKTDCARVLRYIEQAAKFLHVIGCSEEDLTYNACISLLGMAQDTLKAGMEQMGHAYPPTTAKPGSLIAAMLAQSPAKPQAKNASSKLSEVPEFINLTAWYEQHIALLHQLLHLAIKGVGNTVNSRNAKLIQSIGETHAALKEHSELIAGDSIPKVLSRDGKHSIPFGHLAEARAKVQVLTAELHELRKELAAQGMRRNDSPNNEKVT